MVNNIPSPLRWLLIALFAILLLNIGFKREKKLLIIEKGVPTFINRYPKKDVAKFEKTAMKGTFGIKIPSKLQSAVLYSFLFMVIGATILYLYSKSLFILKAIVLLYLGYMLVSFLLLKLGDFGVDYRLSTGLSHYLEDLFLSPLLFLAIIAFVKAFGLKNSEQK
ncbi:MAG: hypothetical protein IPO63_01940 [Bacteroidetes bacterium]|nr:hypothetical protein [Bacteroidota bacterium]